MKKFIFAILLIAGCTTGTVVTAPDFTPIIDSANDSISELQNRSESRTGDDYINMYKQCKYDLNSSLKMQSSLVKNLKYCNDEMNNRSEQIADITTKKQKCDISVASKFGDIIKAAISGAIAMLMLLVGLKISGKVPFL